MNNSSGPFSRKQPRSTNPALFSLPPRQEIDNILNPIVSEDDMAKCDLRNLYSSTQSSFRNQSWQLDWRTERDLADHADWHVKNNTFGGGPEGFNKLLDHQTLMYNGMLAGLSFLKAHEYALKVGPQPSK